MRSTIGENELILMIVCRIRHYFKHVATKRRK